jgi:ABC-type transporter Mla maintaining outer membrane lipid asymmetry ATPase subunit MlaF
VLDDGRLIACETPDRLAHTTDPRVRQFLDALVPGVRASTVDRLPSTVTD